MGIVLCEPERKALRYAIALVRGRIDVEAPANAAICRNYAELLEGLLAVVPAEGA